MFWITSELSIEQESREEKECRPLDRLQTQALYIAGPGASRFLVVSGLR